MNRLLESLHQQHLGYNPTGISTIGIALSAGASSAFIGCPAEFLMIQQQKSGLSLATQLKSVAGSFGVLKIYKGLVGWWEEGEGGGRGMTGYLACHVPARSHLWDPGMGV